MSDAPKVVRLDGKPAVVMQTCPEIIAMLESALASARAGQMVACGIATVVATDRLAGTVFHSEGGYHNDMLAATAVLMHRLLDAVEK